MSNRGGLIQLLVMTNLFTAGLFLIFFLAAFGPKQHPHFTEIDVERVNVLGSNGRPVLVLSNRKHMPGPTMNGKEYPRALSEGRELLSGMIFLNEQGDEVGGLLFNGFKKGSAPSDYGALEHLSFDQWKQNQVIALQYNDHGTTRRAGLTIWDRPTTVTLDKQLDLAARMTTAADSEKEQMVKEQKEAQARGDYGAQRVFVGSQDGIAQVQLSDTKGRVRARLSVDGADVARLEFLDELGNVIEKYPPR